MGRVLPRSAIVAHNCRKLLNGVGVIFCITAESMPVRPCGRKRF
jgi:agmatine/peptidylarginine deiminase